MLSCNIFRFCTKPLFPLLPRPPALIGCCYHGQNPDKLSDVSVCRWAEMHLSRSRWVGGGCLGKLYISGVPKSFRSLCLCRHNVYTCSCNPWSYGWTLNYVRGIYILNVEDYLCIRDEKKTSTRAWRSDGPTASSSSTSSCSSSSSSVWPEDAWMNDTIRLSPSGISENVHVRKCALCVIFVLKMCYHILFFLVINICSCILRMKNSRNVSWNQFYHWHSCLWISEGSQTGLGHPTKVNTFFFFSIQFRFHVVTLNFSRHSNAFDKLLLLSPFFLLTISNCIDVYILYGTVCKPACLHSSS